MEFIDTHSHLYLPEFDTDRDETTTRALNNNVVKILLPNIDIQSVEQMFNTVERYPGICYPMIGLHPTSVKPDYKDQINQLWNIALKHKVIAIGEIGIDLYWDKTYLKEQVDAFRLQVSIAVENQLPIIIHSRDSFPEVFSVLNEFKGTGIKGVFHAFSGSATDAEKAINMGFKLGIGGIVTFKNSGLDKTLKEVGYNDIVLETDSPYLAPSPHRGKRNESSYLGLINQKLSEIFEKSESEIASVAFDNSVNLFDID